MMPLDKVMKGGVFRSYKGSWGSLLLLNGMQGPTREEERTGGVGQTKSSPLSKYKRLFGSKESFVLH